MHSIHETERDLFWASHGFACQKALSALVEIFKPHYLKSQKSALTPFWHGGGAQFVSQLTTFHDQC